ncbi:MAG: hypothetical protein R2725_14720 [Solirubrobacterales bacterium]
MISSRRLRLLAPLLTVALLTVALLAPNANAAKVPPFSQSTQFKALVKFVEKLHRLSNTPTLASKKVVYDGQLENKHEAAVNKSTALFDRAKRAASNESQRAFKAGVEKIRRTEAGELAALRNHYDARLDQAAATYEADLGRIEDEFDNRVAALRKQIKRLRKQKAKATAQTQKALLQGAIERRVDLIASDRELEQEEIDDLKTGYRKEKAAIRAAKASAAQLVERTDDAAIERLRADHRRIYNARVRTLQRKRANQRVNLEEKLDAGRSAIERIPVAG